MSNYPSQTDYLEGHIEALEKQLAEAYAKISEMKCCGNCKYYSLIYCSLDCKSISTEFVKKGMVREKQSTDKCDSWRFWK
jgi:hypothetical protein